MRKSTRTKCFDCEHNISHIETYEGDIQDQCDLNVIGEFHTKRIKRCSNYRKKRCYVLSLFIRFIQDKKTDRHRDQ